MRRLSSSVSIESAGSRAPISVCASSSVNGSSEIADQMSRPARSSSACRNGLAAVSSLRKDNSVSMAGAPGGRSSSSSSTALSASAHCRSSMQMTSGRRVATRPSSSRNASKARRRRLERIGACRAGWCRRRAGDGVHLQEHGEHSRQRRHIRRQQALRRPGVESMRDGGSDRRPLRRAPCRARTRSRSSGPESTTTSSCAGDLAEKVPDQRALADA